MGYKERDHIVREYGDISVAIADAGDMTGIDGRDEPYSVRRNEVWYEDEPVAHVNKEMRHDGDTYVLEWSGNISQNDFFELVKNDEHLGLNPDVEAFDDDRDADAQIDPDTGEIDIENYPEEGTFYEFFYERDDIDRFDSIGFRHGAPDGNFYHVDWADWGFHGRDDLDEIRLVTSDNDLEEPLDTYFTATTDYTPQEQQALQDAILDALEIDL